MKTIENTNTGRNVLALRRWIIGALLATIAIPIVVPAGVANASSKKLVVIGAENQYASILSQLGGKYVTVSSILNNPNADPHTFEASPSVATEVSKANLIVQNGDGYDTFMNNIEAASPNAARRVITVQKVGGFSPKASNPHFWYKVSAMKVVARTITAALSSLQPQHRSYFSSQLTAFVSSLVPVENAITAFATHHPATPVAVTEPVADYLLESMGAKILTPFVFQADIMNGVDPSPENISLEENLFSSHKVKVFCYNQQVTDSLTSSIRTDAQNAHVPVVGVYETMPTPGYTYQTWMMAEESAISKAVTHHTSTKEL